ncbi:hypothetical protein TNCV_1907041 [Trichonephila clavipes]|nr:hypothetical protein TNCV_1907041 [Trichonephila clavipes]
MKTVGWSTRHVTGQVDRSGVPLEIVGSSGHERYLRAKTESGATRKTTRRERIEKSCGKLAHANLTVTRSTIRRRRQQRSCSTNNFRDTLAEANLKSSTLSVHSFNTGSSATASTVVPKNRSNVECYRLAKYCCLVMNPQFVLGTKMITVYGCRGALVLCV